jgi:DNA polymerase delta subunit 2
MLEDESGRLRLIGNPLTSEMLVTGCIVAVMGTENANGDFEVVDIKVPDLPPQAERWHTLEPLATNGARKAKVEDEDEDMDTPVTGGGKKIAIVSGLGFSGTSTSGSLFLGSVLIWSGRCRRFP